MDLDGSVDVGRRLPHSGFSRLVVADLRKPVSVVRSIIVLAKLAKSFGGGATLKVLATFATTKSDSYFPNDAKRFDARESR